MLLENENAVIYGAGGAVGGAVAQAFAREGANVFLAGRTLATVEATAERIRAAGGTAEPALVDALDERAVTAHADSVVERAGSLDVSFNAIGVDHVQGTPLLDMARADFCLGIEARVATNFVTARAAGRHMVRNRSGVILTITAAPDRTAIPRVGSFGLACAALESLVRSLSIELGPQGVRAVCLRSAGSPDAEGVDEVFAMHARNVGISREEYQVARNDRALLRRMPTLAEVANVAAFMASDHARAMTATIANVTCGELLD